MKKILLALLFIVGALPSAIALDQKIVTRYSLDDSSVPNGVKGGRTVTDWRLQEIGPVVDLEFHDKSKDGVVWLGSKQGAARYNPYEKHPWDRWQYFAGKRWLADDAIEKIWIDKKSVHETVWIRTATGVNRIEWKPISYAEKAAHYEALIEKYHLRHNFVSKILLDTPGDLSTSRTNDNDNDGLWSAMYLVAQAYRYAATKNLDARMKARRTLDALIRLEEINPIPGFYSRSFKHISEPSPDAHMWGKNADETEWVWINTETTLEDLCHIPNDWYEKEPGHWVQGANKGKKNIRHHGEWHLTPDKQWLWKGDTSSDETVGHYYAYGLYFDLVANDEEKKIIQDKVRLLTDTLIRDDYYLKDLNGIPTRWGNWNVSYFESYEGLYERALRSMELLSLLKVTYHITGDEKYQQEYLKFVDMGLAHYTNEYRRWESAFSEVNFSDDELYYLSVQPLMMYEDDPTLRKIYLDGMRFAWGEIASDKNALWTYINASCGIIEMNPRMLDDARRTLDRTPWEMIEWTVKNSYRIDFGQMPKKDRHGNGEFDRVIPVDERAIHKHNANPYQADAGRGGNAQETPTHWLLPYWMGRYHGYIE
jgi:hypothetical protein